MTVFLSDNIISGLGFTAEDNFLNVKQGKCGLKFFADRYDIPEPFMASEIDDKQLEEAFEKVVTEVSVVGKHPLDGINSTKLEKASIVSVAGALKNKAKDPSDKRLLFIVSTTKGNGFLVD